MRKGMYMLIGLILFCAFAHAGMMGGRVGAGMWYRSRPDREWAIKRLPWKPKLTGEEKELLGEIVREKRKMDRRMEEAFRPVMLLFWNMRMGIKVSEEEMERVLNRFYEERKTYLTRIKDLEEKIRRLSPRVQVMLLTLIGFAQYGQRGRWAMPYRPGVKGVRERIGKFR